MLDPNLFSKAQSKVEAVISKLREEIKSSASNPQKKKQQLIKRIQKRISSSWWQEQ